MSHHDLAIILWVLITLVLYTYIGYGILLYILVRIKERFEKRKPQEVHEEFPPVTFLVAAWNEKDYIKEKIENGLAFQYPRDKIHYYFVTDGSDDGTPDIIRQFDFPPDVRFKLFHQPARAGKIAAVERVMDYIPTSLVVFSDANTEVNPEAITNIVRHYNDPRVGAVAGEKRVSMNSAGGAEASEGLYWRYESWLKHLDSRLHSVVGAAGELFSIRTSLFEKVPKDTLVEDFYMTMKIAGKGYKVVYEPGAFAVETSSASVGEELKRKIRIAAGGLQAIHRLASLLNFFRYGVLSFQYISHRVLRWTLAPLALPLIFIINMLLLDKGSVFYDYLFGAQLCFYSLALMGYFLESRKLRFKAFFVPYYFCMMNYAMYRGFFRLVAGKQSVLWEKAKRA